MNQHTRLPATIRARVHAGAIDRVTRFYANSLADTFAELLQNARRSGATRLDVATEAVACQDIRVTVCDDGEGIADPAVLLSFGESGWDDATARREDPAGMGIYALSRHGCTVTSRNAAAGPDLPPAWSTALTPDCFLGREEAVIVEADAPFPHGTAISFVADQSPASLQAALREAARYCPLPVAFNGEPIEQHDFLAGAVHAETWRGLSFGVCRDRMTGFLKPDLNFHGLTLAVSLPSVDTIDGGTWSVRADVHSCPELELVLPARKEAVETPFLQDMRDAARIAIYRAMRRAGRTPALAHADCMAARNAGIDMPIAPAVLRPWRPGIADIDDWRDRPKREPVRPGILVMAHDPEPQDAQALWRAAQGAGIAPRLFETDSRLEGYPWYDSLIRVHGMRIDVTADGVTRTLDALRAGTDVPAGTDPLPPATLSRPDAISMHLETRQDGRPAAPIAIAADVALVGDDCYGGVHETNPLVTAGSTIRPHELAQLLRAAYFSHNDDPDADSYETRKTRFDDDAMHLALTLLASEEDARKHTIAETMYREVLWAIPRDRDVSITVSSGRVGIEFGPAATQPEGAPA